MSRFKVAVVCLLACGVVLLAASRATAPRECVGISVMTGASGGLWVFRGFADGSVERLFVSPPAPHPDFPGWQGIAPADLQAPAEAPDRPAAPPAVQQPSAENTTVYGTASGTKYHMTGCSYLKSSVKMTVREAKGRGLTPCSRCHPPG